MIFVPHMGKIYGRIEKPGAAESTVEQVKFMLLLKNSESQ